METWFTVEEIDGDTFAVSEYGHWEETHCYLVCGTERAVLIDTGLGVDNIRRVIDQLTTLPVMTVTTHVHWDHIGGHGYFQETAVHEAERKWLSGGFPLSLEEVKRNLTLRPCNFPKEFDLKDYGIYQGEPQRILRDGDRLELGGRVLTVVHTPGHSPGHCCFYEARRRTLYSGDLIYSGTLDAFYPTTDPQQFWQSIRKVRQLGIDRIFPGHHRLNVPVDLMGRIERAFQDLDDRGKLKQGSGLFDYGEFQIHI